VVEVASRSPADTQIVGALIDSSVWIALEKGEISERALLDCAGDVAIHTCAVVIAELKQGVELAASPLVRKRRQDMLSRVMLSPSIALDSAIAMQWGAIAAHMQ
jgi:predicted nucleic acid-binding protein